MAYKEVQTGSLPLLSQAPPPAWAQVVDAAPNQGALNMTAQLQEITTRRHRLYFIRCTVRLHSQHYHLRIAGLLPARNKMLGPHRVIDPPYYRVAAIPRFLKEATAQLKDNTQVYPLQSGHEFVFLSLSGILFVGSTAKQRYVLHEHLKNLGLAGPPAPILQWDGHLQEGPPDVRFLPFRSLSFLPAELLAISVPSTSWAFEEIPIMSFTEWEAYRRRSLTTAPFMATESRRSSAAGFLLAGIMKSLSPVFSACGSFSCLLLSQLPLKSLCFPDTFQPKCLIPSQPAVPPAVLSLSDRAWWTPPAQLLERSSSSSCSSASSCTTELRTSPSANRDPWGKFWRLLQVVYRRLFGDTVTIPPRVYRPTVTIRGCLPKGSYVSVPLPNDC